MSEFFLAVGGGVLLLLGTGHGLLMLRDLSVPRAFVPAVDSVRHQMEVTAIGLNPSANLWRAWVGFNLSHSLGLVLAGAAAILFAVDYHSIYADSPVLLISPIVVSVGYLVLARLFWFWGPVAGFALSTASLTVAAAAA